MTPMKTTALVAPALPTAPVITLSDEAIEVRQAALETAAFITEVKDPGDQDVAIKAAAELKRFAREIENVRKSLKRPAIDYGNEVDAKAAQAVAKVDEETARIEKLIAGYQRRERERAEAVAREQERIARALAEQRAADLRREEEARREAERQAAEARNKKERDAAAAAKAEADRKAAEARQLELERLRKEETARAAAQLPAAPAPAPARAAGANVRVKYTAAVTDIHALYRARPEFVRLEVDKVALDYFINSPGASLDIPGVTVAEETKVAVRAARVAPAIEA